jgi:hypothetical protein
LSTVSVDPEYRPPQEGVDVPVEELVALAGARQVTAALVEIACQQRERVLAAQHQVMVEPQSRGDQVQQAVDQLLDTQQALLERCRVDVLQRRVQRLAGDDGVDRAR